MMDDEISLAFMNPETAAELLKDNPDMSEAIVAAAVIPEDEVIVVRKDEFLKWLYEDTEKMERDAEDNMDDITFCSSECIKAECFRHRSNIQQPQYPHSYADFKGTPDCPYWEKTRVEKEQ